MAEIRFYHLQYDTTAQVIPDLLGRALGRDMRVLLKLPDEERCRHYDDWLWRFQPESFLPHGLVDQDNADRQPVLIGTGDAAANGATMALVAEGADLPASGNFDLICLVFDSETPSRLQKARQLWKELKEDSALTLTYWKQQPNGAWAKQDI